jgi:diguanylate cyclase (GGDEF)-like protein
MSAFSLSNVMSTEVLTVSENASLQEISSLMRDNGYSCIMIAPEAKPLGIITERDMVKHMSLLLEQDPSERQQLKAVDIMTTDLVTLNKDQLLMDALVICLANKIKHIPVVDDDENLCGIITYTDIATNHRNYLEYQIAVVEKNTHERTAELEEANRQLHELSMIDSLLGIGNRRAMEIDIKSTHELSRRYKHEYTIIMVDVDYFKKYNDHYGHQAGDETLITVADVLKQVIRESDRIYRYGGEEFLLLLPHTDIQGGKILGDRVLQSLREQAIPHCKSTFDVVTASCGIGYYNPEIHKDISGWNEVVKWADTALYSAKAEGRNRVSAN